MQEQKNRHFKEFFVQGLILLALALIVFPGVLRGQCISPAEILYKIPPWLYYRPADLPDSPHRLMSDVITAFHPIYTLTRNALDNGEWPLWNHLEFWGMPLLANFQSAVFYPPRLLHELFDIPLATTLYIMLKLWLCGMTAYICGRGIGLRIATSRFLSVAWMLASYNVIWCNWPLPDVSAWIPVLFLGVESAIMGKYRRAFYALTIGGTLFVLAGHPETAFTFGLGLALYFLLRLTLERRWGRPLYMPVLVLSGAACVVLLVCMVQLLPFSEYLINSYTFFERAGKTQYPLKPGVIVNFFLPRFFGASRDANYWGDVNSNLYSMLYPGIAVWLAFGLLLARSEKAGEAKKSFLGFRHFNARAVSLILPCVFLMLLVFDAPAVAFINRLPVMSSTLYCYHASWVLFALPLLAALGLENWLSQPRKMKEALWLLLPIAGGAASIYLLYSFCAGYITQAGLGGYINAQIIAAGIFALCGTLILVSHTLISRPAFGPSSDSTVEQGRPFRSPAKAKRFFKSPFEGGVGGCSFIANALALLLAIDLLWSNRGLNPTTEPANIFPPTQLTSYLQSLGPHRIGVSEGNIPAGLMVPYGLEEWLAYDGLYPGRIMHMLKSLKGDIWGNIEPVRAIEYFLNNPDSEPNIPPEKWNQMELVYFADGIQVYRNTKSMPRAFLVGRARIVPNINDMFVEMCISKYDPRREVLVEYLPEGKSLQSDTLDVGSAEVIKRDSTRVVVEADAKEESVLVLADAWYPGWKATIDGAETPIFPAYYAFRGIILPAGHHTVVYSYFPWTFKLGLAISVLTLLAFSTGSIFFPHKLRH